MKLNFLSLGIVLLLTAMNANSYEWSEDSYDVFRGDINGDGIEDILLRAKTTSQNFEIPYNINVPINVNVNSQQNVILYGQAGDSGQYVMDFNPLPSLVGDDAWVISEWSSLEATVSIEDVDGDGKSDLYISTDINGGTYALLTSSGATELPQLKLPLSQTTPTVAVIDRDASVPVASISTSVGNLDGGFSVSSHGKANYNIKFDTLPSIGSLLPAIGMTYSGSNANGPLGVGWHLTGFNKITRCGNHIITDGFVDGVNYDSSDRFCLNGEKLIAINGTYGANNTVYRTERDTHAKITSYGTTNSGPSHFSVRRLDGKIEEYGNSASSKLSAGDKGIHTWSQSTLKDREENVVTFTYTSVDGELLADTISYAENSQGEDSHGIKYHYDSRQDQSQYHSEGILRTQSNRLKKVEILLNGEAVKFYKIGYEYGSQSEMSRIVNVSECLTESSCLPATTFDWIDGPNSDSYITYSNTDTSSYTSGRPYYNFTQLLGDIDADGQNDVITAYRDDDDLGLIIYKFNKDAGQFSKSASQLETGLHAGEIAQDKQQFLMADVNGDNRSDIVWTGLYNHDFYRVVFLANTTGTGFESQGYQVHSDSSHTVIDTISSFMADTNGDNLADLVTYYKNNNGTLGINVYASKLNSSGEIVLAKVSSQLDLNIPLDLFSNFEVVPGDINGDGKIDLVLSGTYLNRHYRSVFLAKANGAGFDKRSLEFDDSYTNNYSYFSDFKISLADINGDNRSDFISSYIDGNTYKIRVYLATVGGTDFDFSTEFEIDAISFTNNQLHFSDLNADGRADIYHTYYRGSYFGWKTYLVSNTRDISISSDTYLETSSSSNYLNKNTLLGDVTGDGRVDLIRSYQYNINYITHNVSFAQASYVDHLETITNGYGESVSLEYGFLANTSEGIYTKKADAVYPIKDDPGLSYAVKKVEQSNGVGGVNTYTYKYEGAKTHLTGRGFLGFDKVIKTHVERSRSTEDYYIQDWPRTGLAYSQLVKDITDEESPVMLESNFSHWDVASLNSGNTQYVYLKEKLSQKFDAGDSMVAGLTKFDHNTSYGLVDTTTEIIGTSATSIFGEDISYTSVSGELRRVVTDRAFSNDTSTWRLGFLNNETITTTAPGETTKQIVNSFTPYSNNTFLKGTETLNKNTSNQLTITYSNRDGYGNARTITTVGKDYNGTTSLPSRVESYGAFTNGLYPASYTNAENLTTTYTYNYNVGQVKSEADANGNVVDYIYDDFGRLLITKDIEGAITKDTYSSCSTLTNCAYQVTTSKYSGTKTAGTTKQYFDMLNREIRNTYYNVDNALIYVDTAYDGFGRVAKRYIPSTSSTPVTHSSFVYDDLDRVRIETKAEGGTVTNIYTVTNGVVKAATSQVVEDPIADANKTISSEVQINALGQTVSSKDHNNTQTTFDYDALGFQSSVKVNGNHEIETTFDIAGHKTKLVDPDYGTVDFKYDAFGNSRYVKHVEADETVLKTFDKLNRLKTQTDYVGSTAGNVSSWNYDTAVNGKGRVATITSPNYSANFSYDQFARVQTKTENILGVSRSFSYGYDEFSRPLNSYYPSGYFNTSEYGQYGHLSKVTDSNDVVIWEAKGGDKWGNTNEFQLFGGIDVVSQFKSNSGLIESQQANFGSAHALQNLSYEFDSAKNLRQKDTRYYNASYNGTDFSEVFGYDSLNRLKIATTTGLNSGTRTQTYNYDLYGNITYKSGVSDVDGYTYGAASANAGPHAVSSVELNGVTTSYAYDDKGNMETRGDTTLTYAIHDNPLTIVSPTASINFNYGPDRQRIYQNSIDNGVQTETLYFDGGNYNLVKQQASVRQKLFIDDYAIHHSLLVGSDIFGPLIDLEEGEYQFILNDHLGSTDTLVSESGDIISANRFDPFGLRRQDNQEDADATYLASLNAKNFTTTSRGYTGHEQLDSVQLVHMNGRVYDPVIGRFLSTDQYVQFPNFSQSYNRYSYVLNNPLSFTDPSGEFIPLVVWGAVALYKAYDTYDTITSGAEDLATTLDNTKSAEERSLAATSLASNVLGVPRFVRKYTGKLYSKSQSPDNNKVDTGTSSNSPNKNQGDSNTTNDAPACGCCFVGGTPVLTNNGHKAIDQLQLGDLVLAKNDVTGEISLKAVVDTFVFDDDRTTWLITASNDHGHKQELEVTNNHPFWVAQQGWVETQDLNVGMELTTPSGELFVIDQVQALDASPITYNITVDEDHTYFAGYENIWVHNTCGCGGSSEQLSKEANLLRTGPNDTTVNVKNKKDANKLLNEAFPDYQKVKGVGPQDAVGIKKKRSMDRFKEGGAYHKDYAIDPKTGRVRGHDQPNNPHGEHPHINIKRKDRKKVLINITGE